jgi:hypothetical protein
MLHFIEHDWQEVQVYEEKVQTNIYGLFMPRAATFMRRLRPIDYTFSRSSGYGSLDG